MADAIPVSGSSAAPVEAAKKANWKTGLSKAVITAVSAVGGPESDEGKALMAEFSAPRNMGAEVARAKKVTEYKNEAGAVIAVRHDY